MKVGKKINSNLIVNRSIGNTEKAKEYKAKIDALK